MCRQMAGSIVEACVSECGGSVWVCVGVRGGGSAWGIEGSLGGGGLRNYRDVVGKSALVEVHPLRQVHPFVPGPEWVRSGICRHRPRPAAVEMVAGEERPGSARRS